MPSGKEPQAIRVPSVEFLSEQDGPAEQLLKDRLADYLKSDTGVDAAYLARVRAGGQDSVALCLRRPSGPDTKVVSAVAAVFKDIFTPDVHLDIIFLNATQEADMTRVCRAFFLRAAHR
jgi:hypothetical protein